MFIADYFGLSIHGLDLHRSRILEQAVDEVHSTHRARGCYLVVGVSWIGKVRFSRTGYCLCGESLISRRGKSSASLITNYGMFGL